MNDQNRPFFSVVVPTYGRPRQLAACLSALAAMSFPRDRFEVVVVNDGGTPIDDLVASFRDRIDVRLVVQEHSGPATARNTGAANAAGTLLAFTDDDCTPAPGWLSALEAPLAKDPDILVGGRIVNALTGNPFSAASQLLIDYLYDYYEDHASAPRFFTSNNIAMRADLFREVEGFNPSFVLTAGEDREFCDRWQHEGRTLAFADGAVVYHSHLLGIRHFVRQHFDYGRGAHHFHQARAERKQSRIKIEPPRFYLNLLRYPFRMALGITALPVAVLLAVSQAANAAGFFYQALTKKS
jgi:glycosyltransferase involved in cell wall biosynthesis